MKEIALHFTYDYTIIGVPNNIARSIQQIRKHFDKWLYDRTNDHGYWIVKNGKKVAVSFGADTFVDYINQHHLANNAEKAYIVERELQSVPNNCAVTLFF